MCGILIFKSNNINKEVRRNFKNCLNDLKNRGPDETRVIEKKNILMGFTRLSINDLDTGSQPFTSTNGDYTILFNGEIVNYKNLAQQLRDKNIKLRHGHEAEVIINLYIQYKEKCVNFLKGFFAFTIIENKTNNILAAVDRFSIKPLYYYENNKKGLFIISSDYSPLIKYGVVEKKLNDSKLIDYFSLSRDFDNKSLFDDIKKIKAANILIRNKNKNKFFTYWKPVNKNKETIHIDKKFAIEILDSKFKEINKQWATAEVKNSLCLSTGLDSQILNKYLTQGSEKYLRIHLSESKTRSLDHDDVYQKRLKRSQTISSINLIAKDCYNPFPLAHASTASLIQLYASLSAKNIKTTINGEGADEIFGGYKRYQRQLKLIKNKRLSQEEAFLSIYSNDVSILGNVTRNYNTDTIKKLLKKKIKSIKLQSASIENKILEFDQLTWLPSLLQRHDVIGMHFGLEVRPPYLDHKLVEIVNRMPASFKIELKNRKVILKKLFKEKFSKEINAKKIGTPSGFSTVFSSKKEMKKFKESIFYGLGSNFINPTKVFKLINFDKISKYHKIFLWRLYILNKMMNKF